MRFAVPLVLVAALGALGGCAREKQSGTVVETKELTPKQVTIATRGAIEQWRQAYEVRSIDALERLYAHDPDLVLVNDGVTLIGWSSVDAMLKDRLSRAKEIHIRLKEVEVTSIAPTAAFGVATMTRELSDGVTTVTEQGSLTLVFRKDPTAGWLIVGEHYSYKRPG
ncbi:MAG: nuclear transport factor 2 family protein [Kofleriaceae bacterium]